MLVEDEETMVDLYTTQQTNSETLKNFIILIKNVMVKIQNVDNESTLTNLKTDSSITPYSVRR